MALPNHHFECAGHGLFEARGTSEELPACPVGCKGPRFIKLVFLQAPAYHDGTSAYRDQTLRSLADSVGLTNLKLDKEDPGNGRSVMDNLRKPGNQDFRPRAIEIPHAAPGFSQREEKPLTFDPRGMGCEPHNVIREVNESFSTAGMPLVGPTVEASKAAKLYTSDPNPKATRGE